MYKILIVDDTEINLVLMKALVDKRGDAESILFEKPREALGWCEKHLPDVVIVDYMMPEMDGLKFIEQFRLQFPREEFPVLMVTANDQKDVRYQALNQGANDFLTKPIDRNEFMARLNIMISLRQGQKYLQDRALHLSSLVEERTKVIRARERELVVRLCRAAEFRDPETGSHIQRMAHYSKLIADRMGMDSNYQNMLLESAPMHDIGKIGIPDYILLKPGKLTPEVFELMKTHATLGYELLKDSRSELMQWGAEIAMAHHEKFDGTGYPYGLAGEEIPLTGRIVAVADVFDALTSSRPYKQAWPLDEAQAFLLENAGSQFDPACVSSFLAAWDDALEIRETYRDSTENKQFIQVGDGYVSAELLAHVR